MAIGNAVQRSSFVYVYDEKGRQLCTLSAGAGAGAGAQDGLKGYTSSTVNIRRGAFIYSCDENGRQISITPTR